MAISLGGTLFLKDGNFFANAKSATEAAGGLKKALGETTTSMKNQGAVSDSTGTKLKSLAGKVVGVVAAYASVRAIKSFGEECVTAANNAANANTRLNTIMEQIPGNTQAMTDEVSKYASALSKQTTIGGSAQKYGASQLASFQMSAQSIKALMPQLNNLAVAQYGVNVSSDQMVQAANMLGKAYAGQTGAMTRAGIVMTDAQADLIKTGDEATKTATLVEVLQQNFGNLAQEMAKTPEGAWIRLQNSVGALKTKIGTELQPVVTTAMNYIADQMPKIEGLVESGIDALSPSITWLTQTAFPAVGNAISNMVEKGRLIYEKISPALSNLKDAFGNVWDSLSGMFGNISSSMGGGGISAALGDIASKVINIGAKIIDGIAPIFDFIGEHWNTIQPILGAMLKGFLAFQGLKFGGGIVSGIGGFFGKLQSGGKIFKTFGEGVSGAFGLFKASGGGMGNLNSMIGMIGKMGTTAGKSLGELGGSFGSVGKLISGLGTSVGGISGIFGKIGGAFKSVGTAILGANPAVLAVVGGIAAAIAVGVLLYKNWDKVKATAITVWNTVKKAFAPIAEFVAPIFEKVKGVALDAWETIKSTVIPLKDAVVNAFQSAWDLIKTVWNICKPFFSAIWEGIKNAVSAAIPIIGAAFNTAWNTIKDVWNAASPYFEIIWSGIKAVFSVVSTYIGGAFSTAWNTIKFVWTTATGFFTAVWNTISGIFSVVKDVLTGNWSGAWEGIKGIVDTWSDYFSDVWEGIKGVFSSVADWFGDTFSAAWDAVKGVFSDIEGAASGIWDGVTETVSGAWATATDTTSGIWNGVKETVGGALEDTKNYASEKLNNIKTAYEEHGGGLEGAAAAAIEGVKTYYSIGYDALNTLTGGKLDTIADTVKTKASEIWGGITTGLSDAWDTITNKASEIWGSIQSTAGTALDSTKEYVSEKLDNIKTAYDEHGGGIAGAAAAAMESVTTCYSLGYDALNALTGGKFGEIVNSARSKLEEFGTAVSQKWESIKTSTLEKWESIKNSVTEKVSGVWNSVSGVFDNIRTKVSSVFENVKNTVTEAVGKIKGAFNFKWELPKIKLPHFSISPIGWEVGDLMKGSIPKLSVEWYAKGGIMTHPTVFGMNGTSAMVGGEAGAEAILPLSQFWDRLGSYFKPQPTPAAAGNTYNITVNVDGRNADDDAIANKVARKIVDVINNM